MWFDANSGLALLTIGVKRPAHHQFLNNGIGLRFDDVTKKFVGFGWVVMPYQGSIPLPIWAQFTLMADAIDAPTDT